MITEYYNGNDLGATYKKENTIWKIWAPTALGVQLNIYKEGKGDNLLSTYEMVRRKNGVFELELRGNFNKKYYTYTIDHGKEKIETTDIYSKAVGVNGERSMVVDLKETDPEGFRNKDWDEKRTIIGKNPIIYEIHIKDFSYTNSEISECLRGTYRGFGYKTKKTGIAYLKDLGVNYVHLLPFYDFGSVDEENSKEAFNWGYDPVHYMAVEGSYSTDPYKGDVRIKECKEMIKALHDNGIGVIMDCVFNHTYSLDSPFQKTVPDYYYRKDNEGNYCNGSICGNDTSSESPMFRKFIIDTCLYFATEYKIDGFRFDLMGLMDVTTMNEIRKALNKLPKGKEILMYGEPWSGGESNFKYGQIPANKSNLKYLMDGISIFCDNTRDSIKGDVFISKLGGFVNGGTSFDKEIALSLSAWTKENSELMAKSPRDIISYISAHDNLTLWDKLKLVKSKGNMDIDFEYMDKELIKENKLGASIYLSCLGRVFFQGGEEFARTKLGDENSYISSPYLNSINWERAKKNKELVDYYKGLISIRKAYGFLYEENEISPEVNYYHNNKGLVSASITRDKKGLFVIFNRNELSKLVKLPEGYKYKVLVKDGKVLSSPIEFREDEILVGGKEAIILDIKQKG